MVLLGASVYVDAGAGKAQPDVVAALYASWGGEPFCFHVSLPQCTECSYSLTHAKVILFWETGERASSFSLFIFSFYFSRKGT